MDWTGVEYGKTESGDGHGVKKGWRARRVPQQGPSEGKSLSKGRWRMLRTVILWFLLTVFLVSVLCGVAAVPVDGQKDVVLVDGQKDVVLVGGQKGNSIILKCGLETCENISFLLTQGPVIAFGVNQDKQFQGRVHMSGPYDLIIQDLKTTDAGRYSLQIYADGRLIFNISLEIQVNDTLTGQEGEELLLVDLPRGAESVRHRTDTGWTEVWKRLQGVLSDRLTDNDGHLVIRNFSSRDAGEYRVLNKTGGNLVAMTVLESGTESKGNLNSTNDHTRVDTEHQSVWVWIVALVALVALVMIVALVAIVVAVFKKLKPDPMTPTDQDQEMRFLPGAPVPGTGVH